MSTSSLPVFARSSALLVLLADFSLEQQAKLEEFLTSSPAGKDVVVESWTFSKQSLLPFVATSSPRDSEAAIYAVATLAGRRGWNVLFVADELSKRQLDGNLRVGESEGLTLVAVVPSVVNHALRVLARRIDAQGLAQHPGSWETAKPVAYDRADREDGLIHYSRGRLLHDPDRPVFSDGILSETGHEMVTKTANMSLMAQGRLPQELSDEIVSRIALPDLPEPQFHDPDPASWVIYVLFEMSERERQSTEDALRDVLKTELPDFQSFKISLVPWPRRRGATRRELMTMFEDYIESDEKYRGSYPFMLFIHEPVNASLNVGVVDWHYGKPRHVSTISFRDFVSQFAARLKTKEHTNRFDERETLANDRENLWNGFSSEEGSDRVELLRHPDEPFHPNPPAWLPARRDIVAPPVFFLTQKLSKRQEDIVKRGLLTVSTHLTFPKQYCYVPWDRDEDGTVEDCFRLLDMARRHWGDTGYGTDQIILVDRQSAQDGKVIIADTEYEFHHEIARCRQVKAMAHGRIEASEAMTVWLNLDVGNMGIEDFFENQDDLSHYAVPGFVSMNPPGYGEDED